MTRQLIILLAILFSLNSFGQQIDCDEVRDRLLVTEGKATNQNDSSFKSDVDIILRCLNLTELDKTIIGPQVVAVTMIGITSKNENVTYGQVIDELQDFMRSEDYKKTLEASQLVFELGDKPVDKSDWSQLKGIFQQMGVPDSDLKLLKDIMFGDKNSSLTYKEAIQFWGEKMDSQQSPALTKKSEKPKFYEHFSPMIPLSEMIDTAETRNQTLLLYFTGWADVNSRKMEQAFVLNEEVNELLDKYYTCFIGYADERTRLSEKDQAKEAYSGLKTVGEFVNRIEKTVFPKNYQPVFIVVDGQSKTVDTYSYNPDLNDFISFLKKNKNDAPTKPKAN